MINLTVVNLKDILNFCKKIILFFVMFFVFMKCINLAKNQNFFSIKGLKVDLLASQTKNIEKNILLSNYFNNIDVIEKKASGIKKILVSELVIFSQEEELMEMENQEEVIEFTDTEQNKNTERNQERENVNSTIQVSNENEIQDADKEQVNIAIPSGIATKVIETNNKIDKYTDIYKNVKIKNESKYELTEEMVTPNIDFNNKKDIIVYHTHTCESYTPTAANNYVASGNFRTIDLNYSVSRVGTELSNYLTGFGYNVVHNSTYHDYPAYTGSYTRALSTIKNVLNNTDAEFVIDLHRDALGSNSSYGPSVQIGEEKAAQLMFVIGTDGGGLDHPNWLNNFKLSIKIQEKANEMYPGLFKPIILRNSRYNQHVTSGACIIEVGATGNTIEECNTSMKYLSNIIKEVMK